jgi:hypothetical protein
MMLGPRALMRGIQHHAAGHVKDLSFCLKDPSEIELIENGLHVLASVQASMKNAQYRFILLLLNKRTNSLCLTYPATQVHSAYRIFIFLDKGSYW